MTFCLVMFHRYSSFLLNQTIDAKGGGISGMHALADEISETVHHHWSIHDQQVFRFVLLLMLLLLLI